LIWLALICTFPVVLESIRKAASTLGKRWECDGNAGPVT